MRIPFFSKKEEDSVPVDSRRKFVRREFDSGTTKSKPKVATRLWGRKERMLVLGILLGTILISIGSWFSVNSLPDFSNTKAPDFSGVNLSFPSNTVTIQNENPAPSPSPIFGETHKALRVIDGDTIVIEGDTHLRYIGIDSPERGDCFFEEAKKANENLVLEKEIRLEKDVSETDKYKRLLRYVLVPSAGSGQVDIMANEELVRDGWAKVSTYPPDVKYQDRFLSAQKKAQEAKRGLWADGVCKK